MKNSGNRNGENILSGWLLEGEKSSSGDPSLESKKNASTWLGVQPLPREEKPPIRAENRTPSNFNQSIIQMFSGEPT